MWLLCLCNVATDGATAVLGVVVVVVVAMVMAVTLGTATGRRACSGGHLGQGEPKQHRAVKVRVVSARGVGKSCSVRVSNSNVDHVVARHMKPIAGRCSNKSI